MKVAIAGSSGVIGSALVVALESRGDEVLRVVRPASAQMGLAWDPVAGTMDAAGIEGVDAVVNLAGRSIGAKRWTEHEKQLLWDSRVVSTRFLAGVLAGMKSPPTTLINASAVGFYGDGGVEILTEESPPGSGFLTELTAAWETAASVAAGAGIGVAYLRSGIVLSTEGGALGRLLAPFGPRWLSPFRWGLGGPVGSGRQWWSWITLEDEVRAVIHLLDAGVTGPVNAVSPNPVTNRDFTKALGRVLRRPTILPIPGFLLKGMLGSELAAALVLEGQRTSPEILMRSGFEFRHPEIEDGLRTALGI